MSTIPSALRRYGSLRAKLHSHTRTKTGDMLPPTLQVQCPSDESDETETPSNNNATRCEDGKWQCCQCESGNNFYIHNGQHPLGALACTCPHKPCGSCTTSGLVKPFLPMEEPAVIPLSDNSTYISFGVICPYCGLSWRARETSRYTKSLRKMPSLSMAQHHQQRLAPENGRLRKSRSSIILGGRRIITPPGIGKQAEYATVKFSGFVCTCGTTIDLSALCFQIVGPPVDQHQLRYDNLRPAPRKRVGWTTKPELEAIGHGMPTIKMHGVSHPNPLCSCPINLEGLGAQKPA